MAKVAQFDTSNFQKDVLESDVPVLVDFGAAWCNPCRQLAPVIEKLAEEYAGRVRVGAVDVDTSAELAGRYGILSVPAVLFFREGQEVDRVIGAHPKEHYREKINDVLNKTG